MTTEMTEEKRTFLQIAVNRFFAVYLGVTPPAPGKEKFYAILLGSIVLVLGSGMFLLAWFLLRQMLSR